MTAERSSERARFWRLVAEHGFCKCPIDGSTCDDACKLCASFDPEWSCVMDPDANYLEGYDGAEAQLELEAALATVQYWKEQYAGFLRRSKADAARIGRLRDQRDRLLARVAELEERSLRDMVLDRCGYREGAEVEAHGSYDNDLAGERADAVMRFIDRVRRHSYPETLYLPPEEP